MCLIPCSVSDTSDVHTPVAGQSAHGEENDRHRGENEDGSVLIVGNDGEVVLLERA